MAIAISWINARAFGGNNFKKEQLWLPKLICSFKIFIRLTLEEKPVSDLVSPLEFQIIIITQTLVRSDCAVCVNMSPHPTLRLRIPAIHKNNTEPSAALCECRLSGQFLSLY